MGTAYTGDEVDNRNVSFAMVELLTMTISCPPFACCLSRLLQNAMAATIQQHNKRNVTATITPVRAILPSLLSLCWSPRFPPPEVVAPAMEGANEGSCDGAVSFGELVPVRMGLVDIGIGLSVGFCVKEPTGGCVTGVSVGLCVKKNTGGSVVSKSMTRVGANVGACVGKRYPNMKEGRIVGIPVGLCVKNNTGGCVVAKCMGGRVTSDPGA